MRGVLNINKPQGMSSFGVVSRLRKILNIKKIGHAGTLDPLATGVLPVFVGNCTRLIQFAPKTKSYRAYARLGLESTTYDTEGEIVSKKIAKYDIENIKENLKTFEGKILQTPPIYSAISVNGKRLYEYARKNQEVEIPQKEVEIFKLEVVEFNDNEDFPLLVFDIDCASGVYVRSIIHDLGGKLGTGAMMEGLTRTMSANLRLENSINLEDLTQENAQNYFINPSDVVELEAININEIELDMVKKGQFLSIEEAEGEKFVKLLHNGELIAIGLKTGSEIKPKTVLN